MNNCNNKYDSKEVLEGLWGCVKILKSTSDLRTDLDLIVLERINSLEDRICILEKTLSCFRQSLLNPSVN